MSVTRIVRHNLQRAGEAKRMSHINRLVAFWRYGQKAMRRATAWVDLRPRDKQGNLAGHCSDMAKRVVRIAGRKVVGIASGAPGIYA